MEFFLNPFGGRLFSVRWIKLSRKEGVTSLFARDVSRRANGQTDELHRPSSNGESLAPAGGCGQWTNLKAKWAKLRAFVRAVSVTSRKQPVACPASGLLTSLPPPCIHPNPSSGGHLGGENSEWARGVDSGVWGLKGAAGNVTLSRRACLTKAWLPCPHPTINKRLWR